MEVFLIRHGLTAGNLQKRYVGRTDEPLCPKGIAAAQKAGSFPAVSRVIVSPMLRAKQTAALLFPQAEQQVLDGLREMDFGVFEGRTADEMVSDAAYRTWVDGNCQDVCPGGEGMHGFSSRTLSTFDQAVQKAIRTGESRLVIVAHGGTLMAVMDRYAMPKRAYWDWHVPTLHGWRASLDSIKWDAAPALLDYARMEAISL